MKTFKDLKFKEHPVFKDRTQQAILMFDNGYGISVITGYGCYGDGENPYEIGVLKGKDPNKAPLCYDTPITKDVIGHLSAKGVTGIMKKIQKL